jgi:hypothetical protein
LITGGTTVTIHGSNFSTPTLAITFGTTPATTITVISTTEITVKTPAHSAGYVTVHFKNAAGKETSTLTFDFVPPTPTVSSVTPTSGSVHGGTTITLHGTNLGHGTVTVTVGGVAATTVVVVGTTEITFKLPANSRGSATIVVKNTNGTSSGFSFTYTWTAPTVSSLTTKTGPVVGGTLVTIHGSNFLATTLEVLFGTTVGLTVTAISTTTLTVRTPKHAVGTVTVTVSTSVNKVNAGVFRYASTGMVAGQRVAATPTGDGWWEATPDGGVRAYGNANFYGSLPAFDISVSDIVAIVGTPDGKGYYLVGSDGGVFAFGDAYWRGSLPASGYSVNNIVYMALTPDGAGYYLVGSDGGVFAFGDAYWRGSLPNNGVKVSNIIGMAVTPDGAGYYIVGSDGGVFAFGDAYWRGSLPSMGYDVSNVLGIAVSHSGKGYYLAASDGGVFGFGDAWFYGSLGGATLESPIDGLIVLPSGGYNIANNNGVVSTFHSYPVPGETETLAKPAHAHAHVVHTKRRAYLRRHSQLARRRR